MSYRPFVSKLVEPFEHLFIAGLIAVGCDVATFDTTAKAENLKMTIWPIESVFSLPVPGQVKSIPAIGTITTPMPVDFNPAQIHQMYPSRIVEGDWVPSDQFVSYDATAIVDRMSPLVEELRSRLDRAANLTEFGEARSSLATEDPLNSESISDDAKVFEDAVRSSVLPAFWKDSMIALRSIATKDEVSGFLKVTTLEMRLKDVVDHRRINLLAAILGARPDKYQEVVISILANKIRSVNRVSPESIGNPFALYEHVAINDPVLARGGKFQGTIEHFESYRGNFCRRAHDYWSAVTKGFFSNEDLPILAAWRVTPPERQQSFLPSGGGPIEVLSAQCKDADEALVRYRDSQAMVQRIAQLSAFYFFKGWPVPADPFTPRVKQIGKWVADQAAQELGYDNKMAEGHYLDYEEYVSPIFLDLLTNPQGAAALLHPNEKIESWEGVEFADRATKIFGPLVAARISALYWAIPAGSFLGGVTIVNPIVSLPPGYKYSNPHFNDYSTGPDILSGFYDEAGRERDVTLQSLSDWRSDWSTGVRAFSKRGGFQTAEEAFDDYWRALYGRVVRFGAARENAKQVMYLTDAVRKFNSAMGYRDLFIHGDGRILLPADMQIVGVQVSAGEFAPQGATVLTARDLYRRHGRITVPSSEMENLDTSVGHIVNVKSLGSVDFEIAAEVTGISFNASGGYDIDFAVQVMVPSDSANVGGVGLPKFIPMSKSFCLPEYRLFEPAVCDRAANALPIYGEIEIDDASLQ
ncbi:HlyD family efflux transporter periplasmic adaptor subunit [Mesorhizobium sp. M0323]|uniref:HlyD family efflux transporter periplasmic adaptor subunit n=1 Tax=Mesorhizobium sp. M0323 TaxID=2956938 RepID=UPI00333DA542